MYKNYTCTILVFLITFAVNAFAEPITFTHEGSGSGTLDGIPFTYANFVITAQADTDSRASLPSVFWIDHTSASITISGLGTTQFITNTRTFVSDPLVGFSRAGKGGLDLFNGPQSGEFGTWEMLSAIGPISGEGELIQWEDSPVNTSAGVLVFTSAWTPATFQARIPYFIDVPPGSNHEASIYAIYNAGITKGCSQNPLRFCPQDPVTRAQMAAFIIRALEGEPSSDYCDTGSPFPDVDPNLKVCKYIKRLSELGITTGFPDGTYRPYNTVTRAQMAAFIIRALEGEPPIDYCDTGSPFPDVPPNSPTCKYIKRFFDLGITTGYSDGTYRPRDTVIRRQMAAFLDRAFLSIACSYNTDCPPSSYCAKAIGDCHGEGICSVRPQYCIHIYMPVCGCNGKNYSNACGAASAGVNVAYEGECH